MSELDGAEIDGVIADTEGHDDDAPGERLAEPGGQPIDKGDEGFHYVPGPSG